MGRRFANGLRSSGRGVFANWRDLIACFRGEILKTGHLWWLWLIAGENSVVYLVDTTCSHDVPESNFCKTVAGVMLVDRDSADKAMRQSS